jgi:trimethylguanosine synthase
LFGGAGGNTIAFALASRWDCVISIETDAATLACAQNNAEVYGVDPEKITWVHGSSFDFLDTLLHRPQDLHPDLRIEPKSAILFASPPWGGVSYKGDDVFDLTTMQPYNLERLSSAYQSVDYALYLPRTSDIRQIAELAPGKKKIKVVQYCMDGASKAMVAYIPAKGQLASSD